MSEDSIQIERQDGIAILRFNRPETGNAVSPAVMKRLCHALDEVIGDPAVKAIVLAHAGRHFVAGADLDWLASLETASAIETISSAPFLCAMSAIAATSSIVPKKFGD